MSAGKHTKPGNDFLVGVIEGFYGRQWSWPDRSAMLGFLAASHLPTYVYAPKGDAFLRQQWREAWPTDEFNQLRSLAASAKNAGVSFGIGLSPLEAWKGDVAVQKAYLREKVEEINALGPSLLCILFDDMRGDMPGLASQQLGLVDEVLAVSKAQRHIVCPTYYSDDPVLEKVFGQRPADYWRDFGGGLDSSVDYFWTGTKVCSTEYNESSLVAISEQMKRPPILWDNYPVNDGERMSRHLHLAPFSGRPGRVPWLRGQLVNPMNQCWLSRIPLLSVPAGRGLSDITDALTEVCPVDLSVLLERDVALFQQQGLDNIAADQRETLLAEYQQFDHPCAREVVEWLQEQYRFDPACLTD